MSETRNITPQPAPEIPDKLYFRIGEVARLLGVETHTLRFWEGEFPQLRVGKGGTGQRLYRRRDVEVAFQIRHLLYDQGYTIPGARQYLLARRKEVPGAAAPGDRRVTGMQRLRADLQSLSAMLGDNVTSGSNAGKKDESTPAAPGMLAGHNRVPQPMRRGLHLAARAVPGADASLPAPRGLFEPDPE